MVSIWSYEPEPTRWLGQPAISVRPKIRPELLYCGDKGDSLTRRYDVGGVVGSDFACLLPGGFQCCRLRSDCLLWIKGNHRVVETFKGKEYCNRMFSGPQ